MTNFRAVSAFNQHWISWVPREFTCANAFSSPVELLLAFFREPVRYTVLRTGRTQCINSDRFLLNKLSVCGWWRPRLRALLWSIRLLQDRLSVNSRACCSQIVWVCLPPQPLQCLTLDRQTDSPYWFHSHFPTLPDFRPAPDYNFHLCVYDSL